MMDKYQNISKKGEGTYGVVYKARVRDTGQIIAIKRIKLQQQDEGIPSTAMRQISILKQLNEHPNIVHLLSIDYVPAQKNLRLIFEYIDYDLKHFLGEHKHSLTNNQVRLLMFQLINGVCFCHSKRIIHRDLKPQNLLINDKGNLKIADFGLARAFSLPIKTLTHQIETLWYRAPEILLGQKQYSLGVDIWAVGCIFAQLLEKKPLFSGDSEIDQIFKIFQFHGTPTPRDWENITKLPDMKPSFPKFKAVNPLIYFKNVDNLALDLLMKMITLDPIHRISMKQALLHPYFDSLTGSQRAVYVRN